MSGIYYNGIVEQPGVPVVQFITGNSGGKVGADNSDNINIVGAGGVIVTGNPGTNTLTITDAGSLRSTTYVDGTPYTVLLTDDVILVDTADIAAPINIILPDSPPNDGQVWTIKDWSGQSNFFAITVNTVTSLPILDNQTNFVLQNGYESVSFVWSLSLGTYSIVSEVLPAIISLPATSAAAGYVQINGAPFLHNYSSMTNDQSNTFIGEASGNFTSSTAASNTGCGQGTLTNVDTSMGNTALGQQAGYAISGGGGYNTALGYTALTASQNDAQNVATGFQSLLALNGGSYNSAYGSLSGTQILTGSYNSFFGYTAGNAYTTSESNNVCINSTGQANDANTLRIGSGTGSGTQNLAAAYICGIDGVDLTSTSVVTNSGDQLGQATLTPGAGISITTGVNEIIIATDLTAPSTTFINSSPYTVLVSDYVILVDTATIAAPSTVMLLDAPTVDGQEWTIKDATGSAGAGNTITLQSVSGLVNIDGATTYVINSAYESVTVVWSASQSQYYII